MSSPPQLQLSIQPSATSFKRSFQQFDFDLDSPGPADATSSTSDRHKRARSSTSETTAASTSSGSSSSNHDVDMYASDFPVLRSPTPPPTLPPLSISSDGDLLQTDEPRTGPFGVTVHPASSRPLAFGDFRQHLDSALEPIRSASPLVPELSAATSDSATVDVDAGESHSSLSPNPPTLPPIFPSTLSDDWEQNSPLFSFTPLDEGRTNLPAPELSLPRWIDSSSSSTTHARASPSGWFTHFSYSPEHQAPGDLGPRFSDARPSLSSPTLPRSPMTTRIPSRYGLTRRRSGDSFSPGISPALPNVVSPGNVQRSVTTWTTTTSTTTNSSESSTTTTTTVTREVTLADPPQMNRQDRPPLHRLMTSTNSLLSESSSEARRRDDAMLVERLRNATHAQQQQHWRHRTPSGDLDAILSRERRRDEEEEEEEPAARSRRPAPFAHGRTPSFTISRDLGTRLSAWNPPSLNISSASPSTEVDFSVAAGSGTTPSHVADSRARMANLGNISRTRPSASSTDPPALPLPDLGGALGFDAGQQATDLPHANNVNGSTPSLSHSHSPLRVNGHGHGPPRLHPNPSLAQSLLPQPSATTTPITTAASATTRPDPLPLVTDRFGHRQLRSVRDALDERFGTLLPGSSTNGRPQQQQQPASSQTPGLSPPRMEPAQTGNSHGTGTSTGGDTPAPQRQHQLHLYHPQLGPRRTSARPSWPPFGGEDSEVGGMDDVEMTGPTPTASGTSQFRPRATPPPPQRQPPDRPDIVNRPAEPGPPVLPLPASLTRPPPSEPTRPSYIMSGHSMGGTGIAVNPSVTHAHTHSHGHSNSSATFTGPPRLDPSTFSPGLFRSTMQYLHERRPSGGRGGPTASESAPMLPHPSIPPLSFFEDPDLGPLGFGRHERRASGPERPSSSSSSSTVATYGSAAPSTLGIGHVSGTVTEPTATAYDPDPLPGPSTNPLIAARRARLEMAMRQRMIANRFMSDDESPMHSPTTSTPRGFPLLPDPIPSAAVTPSTASATRSGSSGFRAAIEALRSDDVPVSFDLAPYIAAGGGGSGMSGSSSSSSSSPGSGATVSHRTQDRDAPPLNIPSHRARMERDFHAHHRRDSRPDTSGDRERPLAMRRRAMREESSRWREERDRVAAAAATASAGSDVDDSTDEVFGELAEMSRGRRESSGAPRRSRPRRTGGARSMGDYIRDEEFDASYESLLALGSAVGEAKPKHTPREVVERLETGKYAHWATGESDKRCPICLEDYQPMDDVLKLNNCPHWLHKPCLESWLSTANTCPVCRNMLKGNEPTPIPGPSSLSSSSQPHIISTYRPLSAIAPSYYPPHPRSFAAFLSRAATSYAPPHITVPGPAWRDTMPHTPISAQGPIQTPMGGHMPPTHGITPSGMGVTAPLPPSALNTAQPNLANGTSVSREAANVLNSWMVPQPSTWGYWGS